MYSSLILLLSAVPALAIRSHTLLKRAFTDTCATPSAQLIVPDSNTGTLTAAGPVTVCLCTLGIPAFETTNSAAMSAIEIGGVAATTSALQGLINGAANTQTCSYPDHGVEHCLNANPCAFTCIDGFTAGPSITPECVCNSPNTVCNGVCGDFTGGCSSPIPRRDLEFHARRVESTCSPGQSVCEVVGGTAKDWECVNTETDLESCGGCSVYSRRHIGPLGVDCTSLPHVSDVACVAGLCNIKRCDEGYEVAKNQTCIQSTIDEESAKNALVLAVEYGFENLLHWSN